MSQERPAESAVTRIRATYTKSNVSRVVHADGVYGGPTTKGLIYMAFFSEHNKLPSTVEFEIDQATRELKQTSPQVLLNEWIREVEVEVLISRDLARSLVLWLQDRIKVLEKSLPLVLEEPGSGSPQGE